MRGATLALSLLLGCAPSAGEPADSADSGAPDTATEDSASPWISEPEWTVDEATAALEASLADGVIEPSPVRDWFMEILDVRAFNEPGVDCPPVEVAEDVNTVVLSNWEGNCDTGDVFVNGGWMFTETYKVVEDVAISESTGLFSFVGGDATGRSFAAGGSLSRVVSTDSEGNLSFSLKLGGTYKDDAAAGWMGQGIGSSIEIDGTLSDAGLSAVLDGGMSLGADFALFLSALTFDPTTCGTAPTGAFWMRDPSTGWMYFDFGDSCSGCAEVSFTGTSVGTACVGDLLYAATERPLLLLAEAG